MALNLTRGAVSIPAAKPKPQTKTNVVTLTADQLAAITGNLISMFIFTMLN
jgi:hypothetical protein